MTAGIENFRHTLRQSARINWGWWGERASLVLGGFAMGAALWFVLVAL